MAAGCLDRWKKEGADEAVAAVMALVDAVRSSKADSMAGLQAEVKAAAEELKCLDSEPYGALSAACGMFVQYLRRGGGGADDQPAPSSAVKRRVVGRATRFGDICRGARGTIATLCQDLLLDGCTVLVHGHSAPVLDALRLAGTSGKRLLVLCTEGRPDGAGLRLAGELAAAGVPARVLLDSAVAYSMAQVDVVLLGADLVAETGGVVGAVGTYQVALVAHAMGKPVYVAAESNKFAKLYPLGKKDIEQGVARAVDFGDVRVPAGVDVEAPARDYIYAGLVETEAFIFSSDYVTTTRFNDTYKGQQPVVLDWVIGNATCEVARGNMSSYACRSENTMCVDSSNGPGYRCNCSIGYQGNPYLSGGCTGKFLIAQHGALSGGSGMADLAVRLTKRFADANSGKNLAFSQLSIYAVLALLAHPGRDPPCPRHAIPPRACLRDRSEFPQKKKDRSESDGLRVERPDAVVEVLSRIQ
ncbi:hypothetical protein ZWY2020_036609 [Hordeum vulgare]|nr:hypothetical protein ZWY2020_036609 [Hordeum vulgare]